MTGEKSTLCGEPMTVKELIRRLKGVDGNLPVVLEIDTEHLEGGKVVQQRGNVEHVYHVHPGFISGGTHHCALTAKSFWLKVPEKTESK